MPIFTTTNEQWSIAILNTSETKNKGSVEGTSKPKDYEAISKIFGPTNFLPFSLEEGGPPMQEIHKCNIYLNFGEIGNLERGTTYIEKWEKTNLDINLSNKSTWKTSSKEI